MSTRGDGCLTLQEDVVVFKNESTNSNHEVSSSRIKTQVSGDNAERGVAKGRPLDATEFVIHLDHMMDSWVSFDYLRSERFFAHTYFTKIYQELTIEELRRLTGQVVDALLGNNLVAKFGGDNTFFFTLSIRGDASKDTKP